MTELNALARKIIGRRMTPKELELQSQLQAKVKAKEITIEQAQAIWRGC